MALYISSDDISCQERNTALSAPVIEAGPAAQLQRQMRHQFDACESETREPPGRPVPRTEPAQRHGGKTHAESEGRAAKEPSPHARRNLHATPGGNARAQPVEEPYLDPVPSQ